MAASGWPWFHTAALPLGFLIACSTVIADCGTGEAVSITRVFIQVLGVDPARASVTPEGCGKLAGGSEPPEPALKRLHPGGVREVPLGWLIFDRRYQALPCAICAASCLTCAARRSNSARDGGASALPATVSGGAVAWPMASGPFLRVDLSVAGSMERGKRLRCTARGW